MMSAAMRQTGRAGLIAICLVVTAMGMASRANAAKADAGGARVAALLCVVAGGLPVVAGWGPGTGWVDGKMGPEKGLLHSGDRLPIYGLAAGRLGTAVLVHGLDGFDVETKLLPRKAKAYQEERGGMAIWHSPQSRAPRWVPATILSPAGQEYEKGGLPPGGRRYLRVVQAWLRDRGVPEPAAQKATVHQVVQADLNGDRRPEVLLSFQWVETLAGGTRQRLHSYLVMRYQPRGAARPQMELMDDQPVGHAVVGLCDLDGDGWAEVVAAQRGTLRSDRDSIFEYIGWRAYDWKGHGFGKLQGKEATFRTERLMGAPRGR